MRTATFNTLIKNLKVQFDTYELNGYKLPELETIALIGKNGNDVIDFYGSEKNDYEVIVEDYSEELTTSQLKRLQAIMDTRVSKLQDEHENLYELATEEERAESNKWFYAENRRNDLKLA